MYKNWIFVLTEFGHKLSQKGKRINCIHVHIIHKKVSRNGLHVNNLITSPSRQKKLETILKIKLSVLSLGTHLFIGFIEVQMKQIFSTLSRIHVFNIEIFAKLIFKDRF